MMHEYRMSLVLLVLGLLTQAGAIPVPVVELGGGRVNADGKKKQNATAEMNAIASVIMFFYLQRRIPVGSTARRRE
jgi:hypothetical protein